jgi:hypothetical protein
LIRIELISEKAPSIIANRQDVQIGGRSLRWKRQHWSVKRGYSDRINGHNTNSACTLRSLFDQITTNEINGECGTYGEEDRCIQCFDGETWRKEPIWKT